MFIASLVLLLQSGRGDQAFHLPGYFGPTFVGLFVLGAVGWLIAAVLGFARARAFGPSTRWFSFAAVCLLLFHLQFVVLGFGFITKDDTLTLTLLTFFNVFVILAAFCAIMGFIRLTTPR